MFFKGIQNSKKFEKSFGVLFQHFGIHNYMRQNIFYCFEVKSAKCIVAIKIFLDSNSLRLILTRKNSVIVFALKKYNYYYNDLRISNLDL